MASRGSTSWATRVARSGPYLPLTSVACSCDRSAPAHELRGKVGVGCDAANRVREAPPDRLGIPSWAKPLLAGGAAFVFESVIGGPDPTATRSPRDCSPWSSSLRAYWSPLGSSVRRRQDGRGRALVRGGACPQLERLPHGFKDPPLSSRRDPKPPVGGVSFVAALGFVQ